MSERLVRTESQLVDVLAGVSFRPSCLNLKWEWEIEPCYDNDPESGAIGWLVSTTFERPDTETGAVSRGRGRKEFVAAGTSESGVVKTCWLLAELIVRHELMEAFLYRGVKIFDPHHTVDELSMPHHARRGLR